jgi:glyoxylase-like metal-dependent hydrolase (beta-lactamase superfamily II)
MAHAATAATHSHFTPDRELAHGERLVLREPDGTTHTLQVLHTPGHAANHVCLLLEEDGLLFSGDHILNGSTTVIDPPDGNMDAYLRSLDLLLAACEQHAVDHILPAHGLVLNNARKTIVHLKRHRLLREAKVLSAMRAHPNGTLEDWVPHAYDDVEPARWPVALRSLRAHVERIQARGLLND